MAERITIPAACLHALGGLHEDDPPVVLLRRGPRADYSASSDYVTFYHPLDPGSRLYLHDRILVRQSAPALLAVLERWGVYRQWTPAMLPRLLAELVLRTAILAHGFDLGWTVEVIP